MWRVTSGESLRKRVKRISSVGVEFNPRLTDEKRWRRHSGTMKLQIRESARRVSVSDMEPSMAVMYARMSNGTGARMLNVEVEAVQ